MNRRQLEFFKRRPLDIQLQLLRNPSETNKHLRHVDPSADPLDRATQEEEQAIELRTRERGSAIILQDRTSAGAH